MDEKLHALIFLGICIRIYLPVESVENMILHYFFLCNINNVSLIVYRKLSSLTCVVFIVHVGDVYLFLNMCYVLLDLGDIHASRAQSLLMAYQNSTNANTSEDEDEPLVFKRSAPSKQNQSNTDTKKLSSQRNDGQPRRVSDVHSPNGVSSSVQKGRMAPSTKVLPGKSPTAVPKELSEQNKSVSIKEEENTPIEHPAADNSDSDDEKPINSRLKAKINNVKKEDSDDEDKKPLAARVNKSNVGTSGCKPSDANERKPLIQKNGASTVDKGKSSSLVSGKRPLDKANGSEQSSIKKPKIGESSTSAKGKQVSNKTEPKADDDDMTLSQRMKKAASANKTSVTKKVVSKVGSSSIQKKIQKGKKPDQFSKYSKSTREGPSSNDGQKKWTTLEHNGVIFPPPYKAHGVKMLYNSKPVTLTPEQEEVSFSF